MFIAVGREQVNPFTYIRLKSFAYARKLIQNKAGKQNQNGCAKRRDKDHILFGACNGFVRWAIFST